MHEVSKAINILDPTEGIDKKICGDSWVTGNSSDGTLGDQVADKCFSGSKKNAKPTKSEGYDRLSAMFDGTAADSDGKAYRSYPDDKDTKMSEFNHTTNKIVKDISTNLNKDQKGVVSSAFAKAHEGAEIVEIRSISTTSVMVNAILDPS